MRERFRVWAEFAETFFIEVVFEERHDFKAKFTRVTLSAISKIYHDSFYTTNGTNDERGTGLGLMLCKEFLEKNDGRLIIESKPGTGSTFSFTLPLGK